MKRKITKTLAIFLLINILLEIVAPSVSYALTGGPSSPEFASFEPVATTDMVNLFSGDFVYNLPVLDVPGPDGGGYSMSLSYHSGTSMEEEASWVGYGWSLNPGAINRSVRGIPDDYNGAQKIEYYNKQLPVWTAAATARLGAEIFSKDLGAQPGGTSLKYVGSISVGKNIRYNSHMGYNPSVSFGLDFKGIASLNVEYGASGITFTPSIKPFGLLNKNAGLFKNKNNKATRFSKLLDKLSLKNASAKQSSRYAGRSFDKLKNRLTSSSISLMGSEYGIFSFNESNSPTSVSVFKGYGLSFSIGVTAMPGPVPIGVDVSQTGSFSMQFNNPVNSHYSYGYMYSPSSAQDNYVSDYYVEKGGAFDSRDYLLGVPFTNPDNFMLNGEGLSGGFRMFSPDLGTHYPNLSSSSIGLFEIGTSLDAGDDLGIGLNLGGGVQKTSVSAWRYDDSPKYGTDRTGTFLRFNNDLGGRVEYSNNNDVFTASLQPDLSLNFGLLSPKAVVKNRTSYINPSFISTGTVDLGLTTGFSIYNEDGNNYGYTLPTYVRNEVNLSVDVATSEFKSGTSFGTENIVFSKMPLKGDYDVNLGGNTAGNSGKNIISGEVKRVNPNNPSATDKYAGTYLMTSIVGANYVDVGSDGLTDNDFGSWTKFEYYQAYGGSSNWYKWRIPYSGLTYQKGQISTKLDDLGSVNSGEKEVYYLKKIETKTHVAYFVTNKSIPPRFGTSSSLPPSKYITGSIGMGVAGQDRKDGLGALKHANASATEDPAAIASTQGTDELEKLEKIVVFAKNRLDKPIKTTYFAYDYSLVPGLPNSKLNVGKLTLTKVWFEYEDITEAKISPYQFVYEYKSNAAFPPEVKAEYSTALSALFNKKNNGENPQYNPDLLDDWGNVQAAGRGLSRKKNDQTGLYQGTLATSAGGLDADFDPATWQLKQIYLPSGGQILVEYEQKAYKYVQDRLAMGLVSLVGTSPFADPNSMNPMFTVNLSDIGVDDNSIGLQDTVCNRMTRYFLADSNRIYFKFLYAMEDDAPSLTSSKSEYLTGYAKVKMVAKNLAENRIDITLNGAGSKYGNGYALTPRQGCYDFYSTQRIKYGDPDLDLNTQANSIVQKDAEGGGKLDFIGVLTSFGFAVNAIFDIGFKIGMPLPVFNDKCKTFHPQLSYFKLPLANAKRGGGVRVKRLVMLDPGIESGAAAIYGNEYNYLLEDNKTSSGVATNEPAGMREENALVGFLPKKAQSWLSRLSVGLDKEQSEGPLGESILPGASVGHSRVVVSNIHTGKSSTGYTVHEFFTVKDYPFDKVYNYSTLSSDANRSFDMASGSSEKGVDCSQLGDNTKSNLLDIPAGLFNYSSKKTYATQGFRFIINNMHGQPKAVKSYGGVASANKYMASAQTFEYFEPGEMIKSMKPDGTWAFDMPGKEMDMAMETKSIDDGTLDFSIEIDVTIGLIPTPPIYVSACPSLSIANNSINTHMTSKVIRYPVIQKSISNYQDGIWTKSENLAFDYATGKPIMNKTADIYDGFKNATADAAAHDGSMYSLALPAHWYYSEMGAKSLLATNTNQLNATAGSITTYGASGSILNAPALKTWNIQSTGVLQATSTTFQKRSSVLVPKWLDNQMAADYAGTAIISGGAEMTALGNKWLPSQTYVFKADVASNASLKINTGGPFSGFTPFSALNYTGNTAPANWIKTNEVTVYSPNGAAVEEIDVLSIPSAARFNKKLKYALPAIVAKNAQYGSVFFNDYEGTGDYSQLAHSGINSTTMASGQPLLIFNVTDVLRMQSSGGICRVWVSGDGSGLSVKNSAGDMTFPASKIAQTGDWSLYEISVSPSILSAATSLFLYNGGALQIYVDDIKFQPKEASTQCFVYDQYTLRLVAQFDDQHFGTYYKYNAKGQLTNKMSETLQGIVTTEESQYNVPKISR